MIAQVLKKIAFSDNFTIDLFEILLKLALTINSIETEYFVFIKYHKVDLVLTGHLDDN